MKSTGGGLNRTALSDAASNGAVETVSCLLQLGADPNLCPIAGKPALYAAFQSGDIHCVELLIGVTNKGKKS